jgi:hypothetical protein
MGARHEVGMSFARVDGRGPTETEVRALMKVLIGVDPHKASVATAVVDEVAGELVERASFPQDRAGMRRLERWAERFPERRWAVENAGGLVHDQATFSGIDRCSWCGHSKAEHTRSANS